MTRLANALDPVLVRADSGRSTGRTPLNLDAEDLAMQCAAASSIKQGESVVPSYALCERATQLDPRDARALVTLAMAAEHLERDDDALAWLRT